MNAVVKSQHGEVRGSSADGVHTFKGIPYAAPPFGPNRLQPPQPVEAWSGVREALTYGPKPPQLPYPPPWDVLIPERGPLGEDCLNLNIWSPDPGSAGLPVMVWIPGGMFEAGSGASYDGSRFARDGIVCVTINWRVGAEGFLYLGDGDVNLGLLDQVAALEWVRENIAAFGGDPANVTVFGQSAGAMSVGTLLSMPRAEGLFRRAIAQSGGAHQVIPVEAAQKVSRRLAEKRGVEATREAIAAVPVDRLLQAQAELKADLMTHPDPERWGREVVVNMLLWQPVVDGDVVPTSPIDRIVAGASAEIDLLAGATTDEWNFFLVPGGAIEQITTEVLAGAVMSYGLPVEAALASYGAAHPGAAPAAFSRLSRATGTSASPSSASPTRTRRARRPPICTSLRGAHRCSTGASARAMGSRLPSSSTPSATRPSSSWERTLHNNSLTPCTPPGLRLPPMEIAVGRSTISAVGQPCALM